MVVWRRHAIDPPADDLEKMLGELGKVADEVLGKDNWSLDTHMRQIPDHFHAHARDPHWWTRRFGGGGVAIPPRRPPAP
jgi:hypothetical protein